MYLPPRSSGAAVHEYLTPGVEIVSVDPNCAYNSPISLSDTSVSDADDDECHSAATDDYLMQMNQHQHALGVVVVDDDDDDEAEEEEEEEDDFDVAVRAGIAASPAAYAEAADVARASGNSAMCPTTSRSQTCLDDDNLNEENFDLAAYITDNDYDFQTTVDHSDALLSVHATVANTTMDRQPDSTTVSVAELGLAAAAVATLSYEQCNGTVSAPPPHTFMDNCVTGPLASVPSQTMFADDNVMSVERVSAISQVAAMAGNETDTYSYVEKWLAACMYDETSSAESICMSLVGDSPSNLLLDTIDDAATEALRAAADAMLQQQQHVVAEPHQMIFEKPMPSSTIADVVNAQTPVYIRPPPMHGKGRGKKISMYATVQASDDDEDDDEDEDEDEEKDDNDDDDDDDEPIIVDVEEIADVEVHAAAVPAAIVVVDMPVNPTEKAARTTLFDLAMHRSARQQQKSQIAQAASPVQLAQPSCVPTAPVVSAVPAIPAAIASTQRRRAVAQKRMPGLTAPAPATAATKVLSSSESDSNDDENGSHADNYAPSRSSSDCSADSTPVQHRQQQVDTQQRLRRNAARRQPVQAAKPTTTVMPAVVPAVQSVPLRQQRTTANVQASAPTIGGGSGPSRRKFRSKSYISSSSGSSDDEAVKSKPQPTNRATNSSSGARPSDTNVKCDAIVKTANMTAEPTRQQSSQPTPVASRGAPVKPNARSLLKPVSNAGDRNQTKTTATTATPAGTASDSMKRHRSADQLPPTKRKLSVASVSSGDQRLAAPPAAPIGALEETLLSLDDAAQRSGCGGVSQPQQPLRKQRKVQPNNHRTILLTNTLAKHGTARQPTSKRTATDAFAMAPASTVGVRPPRASLLRVRSMDAGTSKTQASERRLAVADGALQLPQPMDTVMTPVAQPPTTTAVDDVVATATGSAAEAAEQQIKKRLNLDEYLKRRRLNNDSNPSATTSAISNKPLTMPSFKIPKKFGAIAAGSGNKPTATDSTSSSSRPTGDSAAVQAQAPLRNHKHLEEIVIVSMGCNTDVTLPCSAASGSGDLLTNINDTIIKAQQQGGDAAAVKISSNSLIASIQDVLIKKCSTETSADPSDSAAATTTSVADTQTSTTNAAVEHGEDKIIMYLPKDRRKTVGTSVECQTDNVLQFPPLKRLRRRRHYRQHSRRSVTPSMQQPHRQQQRRHRSSHTSRDQRTRSRSRTRDRSPYSSASSASGRQRSASRASSYSNSSSSSSSYSDSSSSSSSASSYTTDGSRRRSRSRSHSRSRPAHLERRGSSAGGAHRPAQQPQQPHRPYTHQQHRQPRQRQHGNRPGKFFGDGERSQRWRAPSNSSSRLAAEAYRTGGPGVGAVEVRNRSNSESSDSGTRLAVATDTANAPTESDTTAAARPTNSAAFASAGKRNQAIWCDANDEDDESGQMKVIDERRIVYVGRIEETTNREALRSKFSTYGRIQEVSLHYKENLLKFGFVTYANAKDAYRAIDCSTKDPLINMYDVSFGGRRAFCKSVYMDLDGNQFNQQSFVAKPPAKPAVKEPFEVMLRKMREDLNVKRSSAMRGQAH